MAISDFSRYKSAIMELPLGRPYTREELLTEKFLIRSEGKLQMYYAPHNEYMNPAAKVVVIGISPGWTEMETAFRTARAGLAQGLPPEQIGHRVKLASQFAGPTRANMAAMLDELGLHRRLGLSSCSELFDEQEQLLYATAMLSYPVFASGRNYNGHNPSIHAAPWLKEWAIRSLGNELERLNRPLIIPLGRTVEEVLRMLVAQGRIDAGQCLWGFPHPSGANGHRHRQFAHSFKRMKEIIAEYVWR